MGQVKFGTKQLKNPTPANHARVIDITSAVAGGLISWMTTATYIPNNVSNIISSLLGLIIVMSQILKPFFGVQMRQDEVPVEDVVEVEVKPSDN